MDTILNLIDTRAILLRCEDFALVLSWYIVPNGIENKKKYVNLYLSGVDLRTETKKTCFVKNNQSLCSQFGDFLKLNSQHNLRGGGRGDRYEYLRRFKKKNLY